MTVRHDRPGRSLPRLAELCVRASSALALDLTGATVLTEAATGPYVVTPVLAALAGARHVHAVTAASAHGTVDDVAAQTTALATVLGVEQQITIETDRRIDLFATADVITNSGHLRPIDAERVDAMRPDAVVSLMFEAWEIEAGRHDIDLGALRRRGIAAAGTNERHPDIDVFGYLGLMAVLQLSDAGIAAYRSRVVLLCDNPFRDHLERGLVGAGAEVRIAARLGDLLGGPPPDAVVVAITPTGDPVLSTSDLSELADAWPGVVLTQIWGDLDRDAVADHGLAVWPRCAPVSGHMGVLPSRVGPEPIVRLQAGGLKVAEVLRIRPADRTGADREYLDAL